MREMVEEIMEAVSLCASHREMVQQKLNETLIGYRSRLESLLSSDKSYALTPYNKVLSAYTVQYTVLWVCFYLISCFFNFNSHLNGTPVK